MSSPLTPTPRTELKRAPVRGSYDRDEINAILDEAFIAHVAFTHAGKPAVIPTVYARGGDAIYIHGSTANRMLRAIKAGDACVEITLLDGLIVARSAFHHSVNYRSVVIYGAGTEVTDPDEKMEALRLTVEHVLPNRWKDTRPPNREEFLRTMVVKLPVEEASAKIRVGYPIDDEEDMSLGHWAGVIPTRMSFGEPIDDPQLAPGIELPSYLRNYARPAR